MSWQLLNGLPWHWYILYIQVPQRMYYNGFGDALTLEEAYSPTSKWKFLFQNSTSTARVDTPCVTNIHGSQTMYLTNFGDSLTVYVLQLATWHILFRVEQFNGLLWNLLQTFMFPSGWILLTFFFSFWSKFSLVQYFGLWPNSYDIPIHLSYILCLVLISKL